MRILTWLLILVSVAFSPQVFSAINWPECTTNARAAKEIREELAAVGFNNGGNLFAHLKYGYADGIGEYYWDLVIQELESNKVVEKVRVMDGSRYRFTTKPELSKKITEAIDSFLIDLEYEPFVRQFPLSLEGKIINVYSDPGVAGSSNGVKKIPVEVVMYNEEFDFNRIGNVNVVEFFGHKKLFDYEVIGYVLDRKGESILTIISYKSREDEVSDLICKYRIFGAPTQVAIRSPREKVSFLNKIIADKPEIAEAYLYLGDSYWALDEKVKANEAYRAYIKMSNNTDGAPRRVLERLNDIVK